MYTYKTNNCKCDYLRFGLEKSSNFFIWPPSKNVWRPLKQYINLNDICTYMLLTSFLFFKQSQA